MSGFRIEERVVADDGSDGTFWRNGERWLRERGTETRLSEIAPRQEAQHMMALTPLEEKAALWSKEISQILGENL